MDQQSGAGLGLIDLNVSKYFDSLSLECDSRLFCIYVYLSRMCIDKGQQFVDR